jgi:hypothetical protein
MMAAAFVDIGNLPVDSIRIENTTLSLGSKHAWVTVEWQYARYGVPADFCRKVNAVIPPALWYPTRS